MPRITDSAVLLETHRNDVRNAARDYDRGMAPTRNPSLSPKTWPLIEQFDKATTVYDQCERRSP
jgi:hypothetical protein